MNILSREDPQFNSARAKMFHTTLANSCTTSKMVSFRKFITKYAGYSYSVSGDSCKALKRSPSLSMIDYCRCAMSRLIDEKESIELFD